MATIKSYTDLQQSKKLAEILPLKSADMHYATWTILDGEFIVSPNQGSTIENLQEDYGNQIIPCWSIAALLGVLPNGTDIVKEKADTENEKYMCTVGAKDDIISTFGNNPVDACYRLIIKLNELNLL